MRQLEFEQNVLDKLVIGDKSRMKLSLKSNIIKLLRSFNTSGTAWKYCPASDRLVKDWSCANSEGKEDMNPSETLREQKLSISGKWVLSNQYILFEMLQNFSDLLPNLLTKKN